MGFFYASTRRRRAVEDEGPVITPREYIAIFASAVRMVVPQQSDTYRPGGVRAAKTWGALIEELSRRVRRHPQNPHAHSMLGIAHLYAGDCAATVRHLQIAVNLLLVQTTIRGSLKDTLCARLELALLLPVLVPLCRQLGKHATARRLIREALLI